MIWYLRVFNQPLYDLYIRKYLILSSRYMLNMDEVNFKLDVIVLVLHLSYLVFYLSTLIFSSYFGALFWGWFCLILKLFRVRVSDILSIYLSVFLLGTWCYRDVSVVLSCFILFCFGFIGGGLRFNDSELCISVKIVTVWAEISFYKS